ncbi:carboxylesterase family protein [Streptomyces prunicolor]|uniref:carboxylesterase/lipase family protein n=1 Tax=Streptomyces prunicolor TaxID=67348 RepID=UPI00224EE7E2|nr:carboxylesterase family protein [Streptomyces prunicolor]MCX5240725.1 carboxylesterase family protein [Streptomyces prunicolor]
MPQSVLAVTSQGPVLGTWQHTTARFLGIPYAEAPVGDLRFAAPVPTKPWTEPLDATRYGPTAQRRPFILDGPTTIPEPSIPGDGVLNLNVFTPDPTPGADLPVLVWIHGGGYVAGSAASPWYDGSAFARDGIVLVSIGYRLGIEGFLHLDDAPDNRGVLDWIAALTWVRDNIDAFGGDPSKVTIAGQSAGGGAAQTLMATPSAHGLFRAAISQSGAVKSPQHRRDALADSARLTERTGVPALASALRDLTGDELLALQDALATPEAGLTLAPFADGELIPVTVPDAFAEGSAAAVPLMLGFTRREFFPPAGSTPTPVPTEAVDAMLTGHGLGPDAVTMYTALRDRADPSLRMGQALTDAIFRGPSLTLAENHAHHELPTWLYHFTWGSAAHCVEIPFAFDLLDAERVTAATGPNPPQSLADAMHGAWVAFIRDLDPGPNWPRYTNKRRTTMTWDAVPEALDDPLSAERRIWTMSPDTP